MNELTARPSTHPGARCSIQGCNAPAPWELSQDLPDHPGCQRMYWLCDRHFTGGSVPSLTKPRSDFVVLVAPRDKDAVPGPDAVTIRDLNRGRMTVTNDADNVVAALREIGALKPGQRLYYYDSAGDLEEIVWEHGPIHFMPGP